jgi:hypothetical protein
MPLKVIGAGLGRTGTLSLKAALEELGFTKCYHMVEVLANPRHAAVWIAAADGEVIDWETLFQGYQATVDWPACNFYQELSTKYPEAKVILTVRDPQRWYESTRQTIYHVRDAFPHWIRTLLPRMRLFRRMLDRLVWDGMFHGRFEDECYAIEVFNRHNELVRSIVPFDRLLVYEIKDGWAPLCAFLGVPVPEGKPFPHLNDAKVFRSRISRAVWVMRFVAGAVLLIAALALFVTWMIAYIVVQKLTLPR